MINIIYGLRDPRNDVYQYIGKSTVGVSRPLQHLTCSHSPKVNEWVAFLEEKMLYPIVDIIEEVEKLELLAEREKYWVNYYYYINPNLLNAQLIDYPLQNIKTDDDEEAFIFLVKTMSNIPYILKKERMCRNLTQQELSKRANISLFTVAMIERGKSVGVSFIQKYLNGLDGTEIVSKTYGARAHRN